MSGGHAEYMVAYADAYKRRSDGLVWIRVSPEWYTLSKGTPLLLN